MYEVKILVKNQQCLKAFSNKLNFLVGTAYGQNSKVVKGMSKKYFNIPNFMRENS